MITPIIRTRVLLEWGFPESMMIVPMIRLRVLECERGGPLFMIQGKAAIDAYADPHPARTRPRQGKGICTVPTKGET